MANKNSYKDMQNNSTQNSSQDSSRNSSRNSSQDSERRESLVALYNEKYNWRA